MTDSGKSKPDLAAIERSFSKLLDETLVAVNAGIANVTGQFQQYIQEQEKLVETQPAEEQLRAVLNDLFWSLREYRMPAVMELLKGHYRRRMMQEFELPEKWEPEAAVPAGVAEEQAPQPRSEEQAADAFKRGFDAGRSTGFGILREIMSWAKRSCTGECPARIASYEIAKIAAKELNPHPASWPPNYLVLPDANGDRFPSETLREVWKAGYKHCLHGGAFLDNPYPETTPAAAQPGAEHPKRVLEIWDVMGTDCRLVHRADFPAPATGFKKPMQQEKDEKPKSSTFPKPLVTARVEGELPDTASIIPDASLQFLYKEQPATEKLPLTLWLDAVNIVEVSAADYRMDGLRVFSGDSEIMRRSSPGKDLVVTSATSLKLKLSLRSDYLMDETSSDIQPGAEHPDQKKVPVGHERPKIKLRVLLYQREPGHRKFIAEAPDVAHMSCATGETEEEAMSALRDSLRRYFLQNNICSVEKRDLEV